MAEGWKLDPVGPDGDHHEELAPLVVLDALPPRALSSEELELILRPVTEDEGRAGALAGERATQAAHDRAMEYLDEALAEVED